MGYIVLQYIVLKVINSSVIHLQKKKNVICVDA